MGVGKKALVTYTRGYFIDGSEQVIFKAILDKKEEPYVPPEPKPLVELKSIEE